MKKLAFLLPLFLLLGGCEGTSEFVPNEGGTYFPEVEKAKIIENQRHVISLGDITSPDTIKVGQTLACEEVSVVANFSDETSETVHPEIVQLNTARAGTQTGVLVYQGQTKTFLILVEEDEAIEEKVVSSITNVVFPENIQEGDQIKLEDVTITVNYEDGSHEDNVHPTSVKVDTSNAGVVEAIVGYGGKDANVNIEIIGSGEAPEKVLVSFEIVTQPTSVAKGGSVTTNDFVIKGKYNDGSYGANTHPTSVELNTSIASSSVQGLLRYQGLTLAFTIEVTDSGSDPVTIVSISIVTAPSSVEVGDTISNNSVYVQINYSDGTSEMKHPTSISFDSSSSGNVTAIAYYNSYSAQFTVYVADPEEDEDEEEVLMCTYRIYFSYSHTTQDNPLTKKDEDSPLLEFTAPMLSPLGKAPDEIAVSIGSASVSEAKFKALGVEKGYTVDPAYPVFLGLSDHGICLTTDQLWDFTTSWKQQAVVSLYGVWVAND